VNEAATSENYCLFRLPFAAIFICYVPFLTAFIQQIFTAVTEIPANLFKAK
jgi:hypothetical protein